MVDFVETIWRDFETDGVPSSGKHKPRKAKIREWGTWLEGFANATGAGGGYVFPDKATIDVVQSPPINAMGWVVSDPVVANNGIYRKMTGVNMGAVWTRVADLPYSFIKASNAGAGTANAIIATTSIPLPSGAYVALITMNVFEANTSNVTISVNGATAKALVTNSGNPLASGYLQPGMVVLFVDTGAEYRLLTDVVSASIVAEAEAAATAAEAARDEALAAVPNAFPPTRTALKGYDTSTITSAYLKESGREGQFFWKTGDYSAHVAADTGYDLQNIAGVWTEVLIAGNLADEGIYIKADGIDATVGCWVRQFDGPIMVDWFGAHGSLAVTAQIDTAAIRTAFRVAQLRGGVVSDRGGKTFRIQSTVYIKNGVKGFIGGGSTYQPTGPIVMFLLRGKHVDATRLPQFEATNVTDITIENVLIDGNDVVGGSGLRCFQGENVVRGKFHGNTIINMNHGFGIQLASWADGVDPLRGCVITGNVMNGRPGEAGAGTQGRWFPIHLSGQLDTPAGAAADPDSWYQTHGGQAASSSLAARDCIVADNRLDGGYYGVTLIAVIDTVVADNRISSNVRGIGLEWTSTNNSIDGNHIKDNLSSGILNNYGCSGTKIINNTINTGSRWEGEGLIKSGLNSQRVLIANNRLTTSVTYSPVFPLAGSEYFIYVHCDANYTKVIGNHISGDCYRAYIGVESAWQNSIVDIRHFAQGKSNDNFAFATMHHVEVVGNTIDASPSSKGVGAAADAIYLGAITDDTAGALSLTDIIIADNVITSNKHKHQLGILESSGAVSGSTLINNQFERTVTQLGYDMPRGRQHWVQQEGNRWLDDQTTRETFAAADTTPSVRGNTGGANGNFGGNRFTCNGNVGMTFLDDGVIGQIVELRGDATSTLVHNNALMRLKGAVNAALASTNNFIVLELYAGNIWIEKFRSF